MTKFGPDEDVDLAELDLLDVVEVGGRAKDDEQRVAVALELGPLVGDDGVLDGDLVQAELLGHRAGAAPRPAGYRPIQAIVARLLAQAAAAVSATVAGLSMRRPSR